MSTAPLQVTIYRGRTGVVPLTLSIDGTAVDVSAATVKSQVKTAIGGPLIQELTVGDGVTITDGPNGGLQLEFLVADVGEYVFDAFIGNTAYDDGRPFLQGTIIVLPSVTDP